METASVSQNEEHQHAVISFADGAKVRKNLETLAKILKNVSNQRKNFINEVAKAVDAISDGSNSEYATFETKNGRVVTIRLADHNATVSNFDKRNEFEGISIVVSPKKNKGLTNDGISHIVEFYYDPIKLRKAEGKPLSEIVKSIEQVMYSGEYKDTTGLAEREEVNSKEIEQYRDNIKQQKVVEGQPMFFKTPEGGEAYGYTYQGKVYIDPRIATTETPIHEYTHLWAEMKRRTSPKEWDSIKKTLLSDKMIRPFVSEVRDLYPELLVKGREDDFVEEVLTQFSGRHGAERLREVARKIQSENNGMFGKAQAVEALRRMKNILDIFWRGVAKMMGWKYTSAEDIADKVLHDLLSGVNPNRDIIEGQTENRRKAVMDAVNSRDDIMSQKKFDEIEPVGKGDFGDIYDQFKGKPKEAIDFLMRKRGGEALGALSHKDVGEIDLVWGEEGTGKSDGFGLAKLAKHHPEVLKNLQEILDDMHVTKRTDNRINLESDTHQAAVRLTWNEHKKNWLLTAFEKKNSALDNTTDTGKTSDRGKRNDTATPLSTVSEGKDKDNSSDRQGNLKEKVNEIEIGGALVDRLGDMGVDVAIGTDWQGNPIDKDGKYVVEQVEKIDDITDDDFTAPTRNVSLPKLSDRMDAALNAEGKPVIIKKNIFEKNLKAHPDLTVDDSRRILSVTLYNNEPLVGQSQPKSRPNYWVAIESEDGKSVTVLEVNKKKDNMEIVGWHKIDADGLEKLKKQAEREGGQLLIQTSKKEAAAALSALTSDLSEGKDKNNSSDRQGNLEEKANKTEIGGALVDRLNEIGVDVGTDFQENRRVRKAAEKDSSEAGKMRTCKTSDGTVYGFVYKGKMYLDPRKIDGELPIHEYGHLWCGAFRKLNPDGWKSVVDTMRTDKETWDVVRRLNPDLTDDNDIAEEMISRFSGSRGAQRLRAELAKMSLKDVSYNSRWSNIFKNISNAIQGFWKQMGSFLNIKYETPEQVYDQVMKDFADKVNPQGMVERYLLERKSEMERVNDTKDAVPQQPTVQDGKESYEYLLDKNTKTGADMHLVKMNDRVDDATYKELQRKAKALNDGYYNRFKKAWHFKTEEDARKFVEQARSAETRFSEDVERKKTPKTLFSEEKLKKEKKGRIVPDDVDKSVSLHIESDFDKAVEAELKGLSPKERKVDLEWLDEKMKLYSNVGEEDGTQLDENGRTTMLQGLNTRRQIQLDRLNGTNKSNTTGAMVRGLSTDDPNTQRRRGRLAVLAIDREREYREARGMVFRAKYFIDDNDPISHKDLKRIFSDFNSDEALNPIFDAAYKVIEEIGSKIRSIELKEAGVFGAANSYDGRIIYDTNKFSRTSTSRQEAAGIMLHEMLHQGANYVMALYNHGGKYRDMLTDAQKKACKEILSLYKTAGNHPKWFEDGKETYGISVDEYEFMAETSDDGLREGLTHKTYLQRLWDALRGMFGLEKTPTNIERLDKAMLDILNDFDLGNYNTLDKDKLDMKSVTGQNAGVALSMKERSNYVPDEENETTRFSEGDESTPSMPEHTQKIVKSIEKTAKKLNTPVKIAHSIDEVTNKDALQALRDGRNIKGWFEEGTGEIVLYLPNIADRYTGERTVAHEVIGHHGLRALLGEEGYRNYMRTLALDLRDEKLSEYMRENMARYGFDIYTAVDEYLAEAAEEGYGNLPMWQKVRDAMTNALRKAGFEMTPSISDVKYMVWLSKNQLENTDPTKAVNRAKLLYRLGQEKYAAKVSNGEFTFEEGSANQPKQGFFPGNKTLFRSTPSTKTAKQQYEKALSRLGYIWKESHIDQMQAGIELMRAIAGVKKIEDIPSVENFVLAENQMSSREEQMDYLFNRDFMKPLDEAVAAVLPEFGSKTDEALRNLQIYMIKKSGLERNRCLYVRDKIREYRKDADMDQDVVQQLEDEWNSLLDAIRDIANGGTTRFSKDGKPKKTPKTLFSEEKLNNEREKDKSEDLFLSLQSNDNNNGDRNDQEILRERGINSFVYTLESLRLH